MLVRQQGSGLQVLQLGQRAEFVRGQPRFLLVPKNNYGGKPLLVVQARGHSSAVEAFGPLMDDPLGARIGADLRRWQTGDSSCGAAA